MFNEICTKLLTERKSKDSTTKEQQASFKKEFKENDGTRNKRARSDEEMKLEEEKMKIHAFEPMTAYD